MNAVGIDISKGKSVVAALRPFGEVVYSPFEVIHTDTGIKLLIQKLSKLEGETKIIMEHTGRYHEALAYALSSAGFYVSAVNPKLIKDFGNNTLRKVKSDKADSLKIARYGLDNWSDLSPYSEVDKLRIQLKAITRQYGFYSKQKTALKNNLIGILDQTFPGINAVFTSIVRKNGSQKWVDFVTTFWHVECVTNLSLQAFTDKYYKWCCHHKYKFQPAKPKQIYDFSKNLISLLPKDSITKMLIKQAVSHLNSVAQIIEQLRKKMNEVASQLPEYKIVLEMTGVGVSLGPQLIAEIGDISRFTHRGALTAFAGIDPGVNQSGSYEQRSVRTSKRGSAQLRKTLFLIMSVLIKRAPAEDPVYCFITKKRQEGKPSFVCMTAYFPLTSSLQATTKFLKRLKKVFHLRTLFYL
ncbi:ISEnfa110 (IS110 family) transposase (plasmid) [Enterococcus mundtii QU 25]|nr:ISEnfa110 (IS110 family) transposase [Enterococcus mundtii QU 25]